MKRTLSGLVIAGILVIVAGCASVNYGPLSVKSLGTDVSMDSASWIKTAPDGSKEALTIVGGKRDSSTSVHTVANVSMALLGAIIGGVPTAGTGSATGAAVGAAGGASLAEAWQTLQDWLNKSQTPAQVVAPISVPVAVQAQPVVAHTNSIGALLP